MTCVLKVSTTGLLLELDMDGDGCQDETEDLDDDADKVLDVDDNCPIINNSNQADYDGTTGRVVISMMMAMMSMTSMICQ